MKLIPINQEIINLMTLTENNKHSIHKALAGILLSKQHKEYVATDAHIMNIVPLEQSDNFDDLEKDTIIFFKPFKLKKNEIPFIDFDNTCIKVFILGTISKIIPFGIIDEKYPNYKRVMPEQPKEYTLVAINVDILQKLAKAMAMDNNNVILEIPKSPLNPIRVHDLRKRDEVKPPKALIMPVRIIDYQLKESFIGINPTTHTKEIKKELKAVI